MTDLRDGRVTNPRPPAPGDHAVAALKRRYDPDNVFRDNFNIAPAPRLG
jgi:FAD/FMN-containing dehydrogenase